MWASKGLESIYFRHLSYCFIATEKRIIHFYGYGIRTWDDFVSFIFVFGIVYYNVLNIAYMLFLMSVYELWIRSIIIERNTLKHNALWIFRNGFSLNWALQLFASENCLYSFRSFIFSSGPYCFVYASETLTNLPFFSQTLRLIFHSFKYNILKVKVLDLHWWTAKSRSGYFALYWTDSQRYISLFIFHHFWNHTIRLFPIRKFRMKKVKAKRFQFSFEFWSKFWPAF